MDKIAIQKKIDSNRDKINYIVCSDEDPTLKKLLITNLAKSNESLIKMAKKYKCEKGHISTIETMQHEYDFGYDQYCCKQCGDVMIDEIRGIVYAKEVV